MPQHTSNNPVVSQTSRAVAVDWDDLLCAILERSATQAFLDRHSGLVVRVAPSSQNGKSWHRRIQADRLRYVAVPTLTTEQSVCVMNEFIAGIDDILLKTRFQIAMNGAGGFSRAYALLKQVPGVALNYFRLEEDALIDVMVGFLKNCGITALSPPPQPSLITDAA